MLCTMPCRKHHIHDDGISGAIRWDSADLNRGPSVPNARGSAKLPYCPIVVASIID